MCACPLHFTVLSFEGKSEFAVKLGTPCSAQCRVQSTTLLKYPPQVEWYRDRLFIQINVSEYVSVLSPYWQSRQSYPRANCVQQPGSVSRYNCDLNFQYCHRGIMGRYRCDVTDKETTISRFLRLKGTCFVTCSNYCAQH